ncbi:MAG: cupin domain-containing protein [Oscillospiraceae bacterium]|nr:cupin domain-containing protein [Oscillospiraceae bacterium]
MIRKKGTYKIDIRKQMMGGLGQFVVENILNPDEMHEKGRLFARGTLAPGCTVGYHVHVKDMEICHFLSVSGQVRDQDGVVTTVGAGDTNIVEVGQGHEIVNTGDTDLVYIALILYK